MNKYLAIDDIQLSKKSKPVDYIGFHIRPVNETYEYKPIEKVIFNDPATIIIWADGSKTVVKCSEDDRFDKEKGLAMAILKTFLKDDYKKIFKKWCPEEEKNENIITNAQTASNEVAKTLRKLGYSLSSLLNGLDYEFNKKEGNFELIDKTDEEEDDDVTTAWGCKEVVDE